MMQDKAIPFLETPPMLENTDLAGNVFFDPVGFSNYFDIKWLREAELKHGRVCMLAVTGLLAQEFVTLPMFENGATPVDDFFVVPAFGLWQVFFAIGALEFGMNGFKISAADMFADGRDAGDFNFDPLGYTTQQRPPRVDRSFPLCRHISFLSQHVEQSYVAPFPEQHAFLAADVLTACQGER